METWSCDAVMLSDMPQGLPHSNEPYTVYIEQESCVMIRGTAKGELLSIGEVLDWLNRFSFFLSLLVFISIS